MQPAHNLLMRVEWRNVWPCFNATLMGLIWGDVYVKFIPVWSLPFLDGESCFFNLHTIVISPMKRQDEHFLTGIA